MPGFNIPVSNSCGKPGKSYGPSNSLETMRKHRFAFTVQGINQLAMDCIHTMDRPKAESDEIVFHNGFEEVYRPGKYRWGPLSFSFYELYEQSIVSAREIRDWRYGQNTFIFEGPATSQRRAGEENGVGSQQNSSSGVYNLEDSVLTSSESKYKRNATIMMLGGTGDIGWRYQLYGCWPKEISPENLDYSSTDIAETTVVLRFDKAVES